jgi:DNA-binding CsgD family transcriptional regulator/transcriptional regulator with GAF, ATPase, and Fis domain
MPPRAPVTPETDLFVQDNTLTNREREIAIGYARGETYHQIAKRLFISPATVRTHLATIYRKLGVSSKIELHGVLIGEKQIKIPDDEERSALISELALSLEEAVSRERALGQVLRIISLSNGQVDKVIASVLDYALELCDADFGILFEHEAKIGYRAAHMRGIPLAFAEWLSSRGAFQVGPQTGLGRIITTREVINIADVRSESIYRTGDPLRYATADLGGARSFTAIPMLTGDRLIGAFTIYRQTVRPFDRKTLEVAQMFADQSVIAIENARLISRERALGQFSKLASPLRVKTRNTKPK